MTAPGGLLQTAASSAGWSTVSHGATVLGRMVVLAALGRWLGPDDFGVVGLLVAVLAIVQGLSDVGMTDALVQRRDAPRDHVSSAFWLALGLGLVACLLVVAASPWLALLGGDPRLASLGPLVAARFVLGPLATPFVASLQRDLRFRALALATAGAVAIGTTTSLVAALADVGAASLVLGDLAGAAAQAAFCAAVCPRAAWPRLHVRLSEARSTLHFGAWNTFQRTVIAAAMNVDYLCVGRALGTAALGLYSVAFELGSAPIKALNPLVNRALFPVLARHQGDPGSVTRAFVESSRLLALVSFPILAGMAAAAPELAETILGREWETLGQLLPWLAAAGAFRVLNNPMGPVLLACGHARLLGVWAIFAAASNSVVFVLVAPLGLVATCFAWIPLLGGYWILLTGVLGHVLHLDVKAYILGLVRPAIVGLGALASGLASAELLRAVGAPAPVTLGGVATAVVVAALGLAYGLERPMLLAIRRFATASTPGGGGPSTAAEAPAEGQRP